MSRSQAQRKPEPITDRNHVLAFGKYKNESIADVMYCNPQYLVWLHENNDFFELGHELLEEAETSQEHP
jgi:uncharacterized protein (DUF3820 family)